MRKALSRRAVVGDRGFESISLQRRVSCEPDFLDHVGTRSDPRGDAGAPSRTTAAEVKSCSPAHTSGANGPSSVGRSLGEEIYSGCEATRERDRLLVGGVG